MQAYFAIKFHEDLRNKDLICSLCDALERSGLNTVVLLRDYEKWGEVRFDAKSLMKLAFDLIRKSDLFVIELSEKGVGLGIEAGYAFAMNIPIVVVAKVGSDVSSTLEGIAHKVLFYEEPEDLTDMMRNIVHSF